MTDNEFKERVITLLEIIAFGKDDDTCQHVNTIDMGVMGDVPGAKLLCRDCGLHFSRITEG